MKSSLVEVVHGEYRISTDPALVDIGAVHDFLSNDGYWSKGRSLEVVEMSVANSGLVCGGYAENGDLVGFARMVTDFATFAWLCDVYVLAAHRGSGLGVAIARTLVEHPEVSDLKRQMLATRDAHSLYEKLGFRPIDTPAKWMERAAPQ